MTDDLKGLTLPMFDAALAELDVIERKRKYRDDPVLWATDYLGVQLWSKQREILYSVRDNRKTAVAAGHGVGKSYVAAILMAWWVDVHPLGADESGAPQTLVASTAPFQDQISAILWNNLRILHALSKARYERGEVDHPLPGYITGENKWKLDDGMLIGQGRKPPDNKTDSGYQGLHATYLLAIGDEAAGLNADMIDALGNITTNQDSRLLLIANPTDPTSPMAQIWKKNLKGWKRMHISVKDSPLITGEPGFDVKRAKGLSGQDYIDEKLEEWGEDDPRYIARVLGQWSFDSGAAIFSEEVLAKAANTVVIPDPEAKPRHAWDIARMGVDFTVGYESIAGEVWSTDPFTGKPSEATGERGYRIRRIARWSKAPLIGSDPGNPGSANRIDEHAIGAGATDVVIDATGMGAGVVDGLRDLGFGKRKYRVLEYYASGASTDKRAYTNARAQHYFDLRDSMRAGKIDLDPEDIELFDELRGVTYENDSRGALKLTSKDDIRRKGGKSPDHADTVVYVTADVAPLEDPINQLARGTKVLLDPWELLQMEREGPGMPM